MSFEVKAWRVLSALRNVSSSSGITFGGLRDLWSALGYPTDITLRQYRSRYSRGDVAARVVEAFPKACWRGGAEIVENDDPGIETPFETAFAELSQRLSLWAWMLRADILAGLGNYSVLLIGAVGKLDEELKGLRKPEDILFLMPYSQSEASVDSYVTDASDPRFGLPEFYKVTRTGSQKFSARVHWSRLLHIADGVLDDRILGQPRLERVWNRLDDLDKVVGGGSEAFWLRANQGMVFSFDKDVEITPESVASLKQEAEELSHKQRRTLGAQGLDVQSLGSDVANFDRPAASILSLISGATGIPQRLLLGSERGELASTQDKENWDDRVNDRRVTYCEPLLREFISRLAAAGALRVPVEYEVRWPVVDDLTLSEKATVAVALSGVNAKAKGLVVKPDEIRDRILGWEPLSPAEIAEDASARAEEAERMRQQMQQEQDEGSGDESEVVVEAEA